ncbi:HAMP domain-containing sensor histidine kinase [Brevundimonas sp. PAMC22021]|uniref:sensor histidine kinase n=1 Tax=Brevundimonas sp. PAMC22021 TaxID=2861285 RepID=UPI001C635916|nr:HAMP domain-containing sensor histidine kinase [Brevundimonas sp. PAMC22021]QYF86981.1 HAMP domain-containing histidine kinase [Brevundimonas sp. PAMC22021]
MRAVAALLAVLVLTIAIATGISVSEGRTTRLAGANLALEFAREELTFEGGRWVIPAEGAFASLAARNPALWLVGGDGQRFLVLGDPPPPIRRLFGLPTDPTEGSGASFGALLPEVAIERRDIDGRSILLAVGGVDPETVTSADALRSFSLAPLVAVILGLGVLSAIALLGAIPLLSRAVRPIVDEAASIQPDDVGRRLDESRAPPELLPLARAFNGALERLEVELGRGRRLISNVAHELRTPLAVLSLRIDTLSGPDHEREALRTAVLRVSRLAEQMLDLERFSVPNRPRAALNLTALAKEVVSSLAPMAISAGYELALEAPQNPVIVSGDPEAVIRAITNLISNAVQHGGDNGLITVVLSDGQLQVIDEGPGVPELLQPRLFEAFAQGDGATGGSGLGLHLTREVMRGLGGEVSWRRDGARTIFSLQFPEPGARTG